jgi:uncharacterized membrane protein (UPF0127 family)
MRQARMLIALFLIAVVPACDPGQPDARSDENLDPVLAFDTGTIQIETPADTFRLVVEIAESAEQKVLGLMERSTLPEASGMLFLYSELQDSASGFWMFRTRIPLDIAYLGQGGHILSILPMEPCSSPYAQSCTTYASGVPYCAALEVNRGFFSRRKITAGHRVVLMSVGERDTSSAGPSRSSGGRAC